MNFILFHLSFYAVILFEEIFYKYLKKIKYFIYLSSFLWVTNFSMFLACSQSHYIEVAQGGIFSRAIHNWLWIFSLFKRSIFQIFWKLHCCTKSLFFELETSNCGYLLIFWFSLTVQSFSKIRQHWYYAFYKGPPFEFLVNYKIKKHQRGDPYKIKAV